MSQVIFVGCDVGGWHGRNDGVAVARWDGVDLRQADVGVGALLYPPGRLMQRAVDAVRREGTRMVIAVDAALAWPQRFVELATGAPAASHMAAFAPAAALENPYLYRVTERFVSRSWGTGVHPLTAPGDKFGNNSSKAQALVAWLKRELPDVYRPPFDAWDMRRACSSKLTLIEVYPKASMASRQFQLLEWPDGTSMAALGSGDLDDAKRCAMTAACYASTVGLIEGDFPCVCVPADAPDEDAGVIVREGWIFTPTCRSEP